MKSVSEASQIISENMDDSLFNQHVSNLLDIKPLLLMEDIISDRPYPPFDRVMMDGYAIDTSDVDSSSTSKIIDFQVIGFQKAGEPPLKKNSSLTAIEVSTGGVLSVGMNCVVPYEKIEKEGGVIRIQMSDIIPYNNVARLGEDAQKGDLLISKGTFLKPQHYSILASVGKLKANVLRFPNITLITTGDELVDATTINPLPHQIRRSNDVTLEMMLRQNGFNDITKKTISDNLEETMSIIQEAMEGSPLVICTGGVSMGKKDLVREALEKNNVAILLHKVSQKPGKPLLIGKKSKSLFFGLPGNPVSATVCLRKYVIGIFFEKLGLKTSRNVSFDVTLSKETVLIKKQGMTFFIPVCLLENGKATWIKGNGSGDFIHIANSDGLMELPENIEEVTQGEFLFLPWVIR